MLKALLRLGLILVVSVVIIGGALVFLRWLGLSQEFAPLNHPLAQRPFLVFAETGDMTGDPPQSKLAIEKLMALCPECIPRLDARRSLDGQWYAFASPDMGKWTGKNDQYFSLMNSDEIDNLTYPSEDSDTLIVIPKLKDVVEQFPETPFLVVIHSRDASQLNEVLQALESRKNKGTIVVHSPFRQMLTDARKQRPTWLFGVSPSGLARMVMMEALYIEPMADIWSDLVISPVKLHQTSILTPRLLAEFERRHKLLILDNPGPLDQLPVSLQQAMDGVITKNISEALSFFRSRPATNN